MTQCKVCEMDEAIDGQELCEGCLSVKQWFENASPEEADRMCRAARQMADDMLDERFGPEAGAVVH